MNYPMNRFEECGYDIQRLGDLAFNSCRGVPEEEHKRIWATIDEITKPLFAERDEIIKTNDIHRPVKWGWNKKSWKNLTECKINWR